ncbi:restriction endonuclease subunit S [Morganella morganii]|uniref:restriction endonuclease subunit S n=1 Tax=Morganella morganii TaxID=582 RepID=UPI0032DAC5A1
MLPKDWNQATLESLCHAPITYGVLKPGEYCTNGTPLLQIKDLLGNLDNQENIHRISDELDFEYRRSKIQVNDILISLVGTVGRIAIVPASLDGANIHRNIARIRTKNYEFLVHYLNSDVAKNRIGLSSSGSSQSALNLSVLRALKVPVPPLPEQQKIAKILSTWDNAISATKRLLENSQQRKKALMQQLLTGKKRLPGFEGEWVKKRLIDVVKIETGSSKSASVNDNGTNFIIDMGSVTRSGRLVPTKRTSLDGPYLVTGQLVMPKDDIGGGNIIGRVGVIPEDNKYILADHVYALTPLGGIDSHFLGYLINSDVVNKSLRRKANGTAQLGLGRKDVERQDILIPSDIREQKSIGQIILLNDQENELLQKRLDHLRLEKKALMQQLLTGKRRVLVDTAA